MDDDTKVKLVEAANLLINSPKAHEWLELVDDVAPIMARHKEVSLRGDLAEKLETLIRAKFSHPETYNAVLRLIETKRSEKGFDPLRAEVDLSFDKSNYMAEFMAQKRARERRAVLIENSLRAPRDKLIGRTRMDFMQRQSETWKKAKDAIEKKAREAHGGESLRRDELQSIAAAFWSKVDAELDEREESARRVSLGITPVNTVSLKELTSALEHDPYR